MMNFAKDQVKILLAHSAIVAETDKLAETVGITKEEAVGWLACAAAGLVACAHGSDFSIALFKEWIDAEEEAQKEAA